MKVCTRRLAATLLTALVVSSLISSARPIWAGEALMLRGVHNALGGTMTPAFVAQDLGLFAKHGLQHSLQYIAATTAIQAIAASSQDIGLVGNQCIDVALEGADLVYIANTASRFIFQL